MRPSASSSGEHVRRRGAATRSPTAPRWPTARALPAWLTFNAGDAHLLRHARQRRRRHHRRQGHRRRRHGAAVDDTFDLTVANTNDAPTVANADRRPERRPRTRPSPSSSRRTRSPMSMRRHADLQRDPRRRRGATSWLTFNAATRTFSGTPRTPTWGPSRQGHGDRRQRRHRRRHVRRHGGQHQRCADGRQPHRRPERDRGCGLHFQFAANTFADVDVGDTLTYSATLADGAALPGWLTFNADDAHLHGTPLNANVGTLNVSVTATTARRHGRRYLHLVSRQHQRRADGGESDCGSEGDGRRGLQLPVPANTFADVDAGDTLDLHRDLAGGAALPAWLTSTRRPGPSPGRRSTPMSGTISSG